MKYIGSMDKATKINPLGLDLYEAIGLFRAFVGRRPNASELCEFISCSPGLEKVQKYIEVRDFIAEEQQTDGGDRQRGFEEMCRDFMMLHHEPSPEEVSE